IEHGKLIETWRFRDESSDSTSTEEIIQLTEKIFKSRITSQEGPGKPEGQVLPSQIFTVTRVTEKKKVGEPACFHYRRRSQIRFGKALTPNSIPISMVLLTKKKETLCR